jgi:hypothetical protein
MANLRHFTLGLLCTAIFAVPFCAAAAGFPSGTLFLSQESVTEGQTVLVHVLVFNDAKDKFAGTLSFTDTFSGTTTDIGTVPVSLGAGESTVASVSWKPKAGTHTISTNLLDSDKLLVQTQQQDFPVASNKAPPPPGAIEPSTSIQEGIGSISPSVEHYTQPVFSALDSARSSAAKTIDKQLSTTKAKLDTGGKVLGAQTQQQGLMGTIWNILNTIYFYILTLLRFIIGSAAVFYPVVAVLFLWMLWRGYRLARRPRY